MTTSYVFSTANWIKCLNVLNKNKKGSTQLWICLSEYWSGGNFPVRDFAWRICLWGYCLAGKWTGGTLNWREMAYRENKAGKNLNWREFELAEKLSAALWGVEPQNVFLSISLVVIRIFVDIWCIKEDMLVSSWFQIIIVEQFLSVTVKVVKKSY